MGITYNDAKGHMKSLVSMMDMNGDGYPDVIAGNTIQYTNSQGGMSGEKYNGIGNASTLIMLLMLGAMVVTLSLPLLIL